MTAVYPSGRRTLHQRVLAGVVILLLIAQQMPKIPGSGRLMGGLENALHGPWFAAVMWLFLTLFARVLPGWRGIAAAAVTVVALAFGTEALQFVTGGDPELFDVRSDLMGATAALLAWFARTRRTSRGPTYLVAVILFVSTLLPLADAVAVEWQRRTSLPELVHFGAPFTAALYRANSPAAVVRAPSQWHGFQRALRVELADQRWPGVRFDEPLADWRAYSALTIDAYIAGNEPLPVTVSVRLDHAPVDHVYRTFACAPGPCRISLPLTGLFDRTTARVNAVVIYSRQQYAGRTLYLGSVGLE